MTKKLYTESSVEDIADAIRAKNGSSDTYTVGEMAAAISAITTDYEVPADMNFGSSTFSTFPSGLTFATRTDCYDMFAMCSNLVSPPLFDTSQVTDMGAMFYDCAQLETVPAYDTGNAEHMDSMFEDCVSLTTVPVFDMSSVETLYMAFVGCDSLSDTSLQNILKSLLTLSSEYTEYKYLRNLGLSVTQTDKCVTFPEWATLQEMGWAVAPSA